MGIVNAQGNSNAPVVVDVWEDFQCPYCRRFAEGPEKVLRQTLVPTGQVRLVFHNFAFLGPESVWAAEAAECAAKQGRFWDYQDKLFAEQHGENAGWFNRDNLIRFASELGLDVPGFTQCLDQGSEGNEVLAEYEQGKLRGVSGTPTVFVNGRKLRGVPSWEELHRAIEHASPRAA